MPLPRISPDILKHLVSYQRMFQWPPRMKIVLQWASTQKHVKLQKMVSFPQVSGKPWTQLKEEGAPRYAGLHQVKHLKTRQRLNFRTEFCTPEQAEHSQNLWMVGSCSLEHKINLLGIHTCAVTLKIRAPRQRDLKTVIILAFRGNVFMFPILADAAFLSQAESCEQRPLLQVY